MNYVINSVYVKNNIPTCLEEIAKNLQACNYCAFQDNEDLDIYIKQIQHKINSYKKKGYSLPAVKHSNYGSSGSIDIVSTGSSQPVLFIMITYFKIDGTLTLAKNKEGVLRRQNFLTPIDNE